MPYSVMRSDPILRQVSKPVDAIVHEILALPPSVREREMTRILNGVEYGLAYKVRRVANSLGKKGTPPRDALKSALRLTLADWGLKEIKRLGSRRRSVQGLGATVGRTLTNIGQGITCGIASSTEAQALAVRLQGGTASTAGMATSAGFDVARQICPGSGGGGSSAPLPPAPASSSIPWVPILIGGTLLVGIVVVVKMKS